MAEFNFLKNDMTSGQVSPLLGKLSGNKRHANGLKSLQNMTILPQGGVTSRPGSKFIAEVKTSSQKTRMISFEFSTTQSYAIELGNQYIRIYKDSGQVLESDITITGITQADPGVITSVAHGLLNGDQVYLTEIVGMTELNKTTLFFTVSNKTDDTFEIQDRDGTDVDTTGFTAYTSGGVINRIFTIVSPYVTADLFKLQFTQSADVITLTHQNYAPRDLTRTSDTNWTLTPLMKDVDSPSATLAIIDGPYLNENTTDTTVTTSGTDGSVTVTASAVTGINSDTGFQTSDIGRLLRFHDGTDFHYLEITARTSTTVVTATVVNGPLGATTATKRWRLGSWSETTGFPRSVTYHQQRRVYASTREQIDTLWASAIDDFVDFIPDTADASAYNYTLASTKVNAIYWLASSTRLRIGTEGGIWTLWGGSTTSSITPTNKEADNENILRCKEVAPLHLGTATLYAQRSGKILRELVFSFEADALIAPDITIVSENILGDVGDLTDEGIVDMAYQMEPVSTIWAVLDNGNLAGLTYLRPQDIVGWHIHKFGGTDVAVESVVSVPIQGQDRVWVIVKRTINGVTRRFIEHLDTQYRGKLNRDAIFLDSSITFSGETFSTTLTPGATSGTGITFTAGSSVFASSDIGRLIEGNKGKAIITGFTSGTVVTADISKNFTDTSAIAAGAWTLSQKTLTGLDHLEGESVSILTDGGTHPNRTVSSGSITLDATFTKSQVGEGYTQEVETLDIDFGSVLGTSYGSRSKIEELILEYFESVGGFVGFDADNLTEILFRQGDDLTDEGVPLFTGMKKPRPKGGWRDSTKTLIRQTDPLPMTLLSMVIKGNVTD